MTTQQLTNEIGELEALVDLCANNQQLQESLELSSVREVLRVVADRLTTLKNMKPSLGTQSQETETQQYG